MFCRSQSPDFMRSQQSRRKGKIPIAKYYSVSEMAALLYFVQERARRALNRERVFRDRQNPFDLNERDIVTKYRLHRQSIIYLCYLLSDDLERPTARCKAIRMQICACSLHVFFELCGIPNVLGAIDGTLIPIKRPEIYEHLYVCRQGYHAINVQAVCDSRLEFTDVVRYLSAIRT